MAWLAYNLLADIGKEIVNASHLSSCSISADKSSVEQ
jgi:hypothetical protein